jgi:hypothetical protein
LEDDNEKFEIKFDEGGNLKIEAAYVSLMVVGEDFVGNASSITSSLILGVEDDE